MTGSGWRVTACEPNATVPFACNFTPGLYEQIFLVAMIRAH
jgi:hypothetical protein